MAHRRATAGLVLVMTAGAAHADPKVPPIAPLQPQREDAERVSAERRALGPAGDKQVGGGVDDQAVTPPRPSSSSHGLALLGTAGVAALIASIALVATNSDREPTQDTLALGFGLGGTAALVAAIAIGSSRKKKVALAPVAGAGGAVGFVIAGRL